MSIQVKSSQESLIVFSTIADAEHSETKTALLQIYGAP